MADGSGRWGTGPATEAVVVAGTMRGIALQWLANPHHVALDAASGRVIAAIGPAYRPERPSPT